MPRFIGAYVPGEYNQTAFRELYEFNVIPPVNADHDPLAVLPAFVTPELNDSHVAEELATAYGAQEPGGIIQLTIREIVFDETETILKFNLPVRVKSFASENRGPSYIQIGLLDLDAYFRIERHAPPVDQNNWFLEIIRKPDVDRECIEEPGAENDLVEVPAE